MPTYDGRNYLKDVPAGSNKPLIVFLHGGTGSASAIRTSVGFSSAVTNNAIIAWPDANNNATLGYTAWNSGGYFATGGSNDLAWLNGLINQIVTDESVDTTKIYMMGYSNGGMMTHRYTSETIRDSASYTHDIAKAVIINATQTMTEAYSYTGRVMVINGYTDATVPYFGGNGFRSQAYIQDRLLSTPTVGANSEILIINSGHDFADIKTAMTARGESFEAAIIRFLGL